MNVVMNHHHHQLVIAYRRLQCEVCYPTPMNLRVYVLPILQYYYYYYYTIFSAGLLRLWHLSWNVVMWLLFSNRPTFTRECAPRRVTSLKYWIALVRNRSPLRRRRFREYSCLRNDFKMFCCWSNNNGNAMSPRFSAASCLRVGLRWIL